MLIPTLHRMPKTIWCAQPKNVIADDLFVDVAIAIAAAAVAISPECFLCVWGRGK